MTAASFSPQVAVREPREEARRLLVEGTDLGEQRKAAKAQVQLQIERTFEAAARAWLQHNAARWAARTWDKVMASLEADAFQMLGSRPIASIAARDVTAVVQEWLESNPTLHVRADEFLKPRVVRQRSALPEAELPDFLQRQKAYEGDPATGLALRLLLLTVVRPVALRGAGWKEIDLKEKRWRTAAKRMAVSGDRPRSPARLRTARM